MDEEIKTRSKVLAEAEEIINGERAVDYGDAKESFQAISRMWSAYIGIDVSSADVCHMMTLLKIARLRRGPHRDSSVDACGYMALSVECDEG
tara:strand:+ start:1073 stop:1348 length:276 start_codon:yes stop_codon:yes gene_type:complete